MKREDLFKNFMPTSVCCFTCKYFQTDVAYSNGKPCEFIGKCLHPKRMRRADADDCCPDHDFADWAKNEWQEICKK